MSKISAKIIADSIDTRGNRLISYVLTYPRFIHSELMTHRMFSRNSASSRAIPFKKMIEKAKTDPFIPIAWQRDHSGMQGAEYITDERAVHSLTNQWLEARNAAVQSAQNLNTGTYALEVAKDEYGHNMRGFNVVNIPNTSLTKQLCNRLLEPFMWHTVIVTATEYDNFFNLRCPKYEIFAGPEDTEEYRCFGYSWKDLMKSNGGLAGDFDTDDIVERLSWSKSGAEIHIQTLAEAMWDARNESTPKQLKPGEWHIPFGNIMDDEEILKLHIGIAGFPHEQDKAHEFTKVAVATARCARLSYMTHDNKIDYLKDIELHDRLLSAHHMSPFEHCAKTMTDKEYNAFVKGYREEDKGFDWLKQSALGWCLNFRGFMPYRYFIEDGTI